MSGEDWYNTPSSNEQHRQSNNPFVHNQTENPWQTEQSANPVQYAQSNNDQGYSAPPGPPPGYQNNSAHVPASMSGWNDQHNPSSQAPSSGAAWSNPPGQPPRRANTFEETSFIPAEERGEQREALEHFEMQKGAESEEDRDVATLQVSERYEGDAAGNWRTVEFRPFGSAMKLRVEAWEDDV
ncbi:hypothetical protein LTR86_007343 [Recurvomyces mirabilis]|nr:hypothetical protein LTR86_007343 [Recurvomyces mirabilis]